MSAKSTVDLSREEAESRLVEVLLRSPPTREQAVLLVRLLDNEQLGDALDRAHSAEHDGMGYENYLVW